MCATAGTLPSSLRSPPWQTWLATMQTSSKLPYPPPPPHPPTHLPPLIPPLKTFVPTYVVTMLLQLMHVNELCQSSQKFFVALKHQAWSVLLLGCVLCSSDGLIHPRFGVALMSAGSMCAFLVDAGSGLISGPLFLLLHACSTSAVADLIVFPIFSFVLWHVI